MTASHLDVLGADAEPASALHGISPLGVLRAAELLRAAEYALAVYALILLLCDSAQGQLGMAR